jgi:dipeptidyl aminopeptidase/acylaminoacyl peptidase
LWKYDIKSGELTKAAVFSGYQTSIINGDSKGISTQRGYFRKQQLNFRKAIVVKLYDPYKNLTSYVLWHNGKSETIVPPTTKRVHQLNYNKAYDWFSWVEEDYNMPPQIVFKMDGAVGKVIYQSNKTDKAVVSLKQEIFSYNGSDGVSLKGILYYPLGYKPSVKYPMVVHIYKVQSKKALNEYPVVSYGKANNDGFDLRLLLENGYFVYLPDIVYGEKGPGLSALECVNNSLDALKNNASIDKSKIALIGHSHGGYETNFIATHSVRFATYVTGAGNIDIVRSYFSFNYNFHCPFYFQYENGQYEMKKSFSEDKERYFQNNPIFSVDKVNAPVLLWTGETDQNIYWEQTMEFYIGLKRNKKKVVALFYPNEGHTINATEASKDLGSRILEWFNYFLKDNKNAEWINKEMKEDAK